MKNFFKRIWMFFKGGGKHQKSAFKLLFSLIKISWRKKAPHTWVLTSPGERSRTKIYARCSRCGARR